MKAKKPSELDGLCLSLMHTYFILVSKNCKIKNEQYYSSGQGVVEWCMLPELEQQGLLSMILIVNLYLHALKLVIV